MATAWQIVLPCAFKQQLSHIPTHTDATAVDSAPLPITPTIPLSPTTSLPPGATNSYSFKTASRPHRGLAQPQTPAIHYSASRLKSVQPAGGRRNSNLSNNARKSQTRTGSGTPVPPRLQPAGTIFFFSVRSQRILRFSRVCSVEASRQHSHVVILYCLISNRGFFVSCLFSLQRLLQFTYTRFEQTFWLVGHSGS